MKSWCLLLLVALSASGEERGLLVRSASISRSASELMSASRRFAPAADRLQADERGSIETELEGLGRALAAVAESLRILEPMLLVRRSVDLSQLVERTPADAALKENLRLVAGYGAAV